MKTSKLLFLILVVFSMMLAACSNEIPDAKNYPVEDFTFVNQDGDEVGLEDLKGQVWLANFIFTSCADVCPPMTANMKRIQDRLEKEGLNARIVSFSVDPTVDTPEKLQEYAMRFNADLDRWSFLTGYSQQEIEKFALKNFKTLVKKPENEDQVIHGTDFYLVDQNGTFVKYYNGLKEVPYDDIVKHVEILEKKK